MANEQLILQEPVKTLITDSVIHSDLKAQHNLFEISKPSYLSLILSARSQPIHVQLKNTKGFNGINFTLDYSFSSREKVRYFNYTYQYRNTALS